MDFNDTLFWLVSLSTALLGLRTLAQRPLPWGWCAVLLVLAAGLAAGRIWLPDYVGILGLVYWMVLVLIPTLGQRVAVHLASTRRPRAARFVARLITRLHPADGWNSTRDFVDALIALQQGRDTEAALLLARLQDARTSVGRSVIALQIRQTGHWQRFLAWIDIVPDRDALLADGNLLDVYLQSLGETGRRNQMLHEFARRLRGHAHAIAQLRVAALAGEVDVVEQLLRGSQRGWPSEVAEYWRASARQVAGRRDEAGPMLESLTASENALIARLARQRLEQPLPELTPEELDESARTAIHTLRSDVEHEARFAVMSSTPDRRPIVTCLIALVLTINFFREIPGGTQDLDNLIDLGAIVIPRRPHPELPFARTFDEWWRPITAACLHFGWAHFLMNLCGLLYLGTRFERACGHVWTVLCYAAAVAASMTLTPWLLERNSRELQILAGALGGIMGLLGGLLGFLVVGRFRRHTPLVARQLSLLIGFVLLQTAFDLSHREVSQQAHLLGLTAGFMVGLFAGLFPVRGRSPLHPTDDV